MEIRIVEPAPADAPAIARFCQPIYAATYPNDKYSILPEYFAPEIFDNADTLKYFTKTFSHHDHQRAYLAKRGDEIVGCISIEQASGYYEIHGFYVSPELRGKGVGGQLMAEALAFCTQASRIRVEVAETNQKTIDIYRHWGFVLTPELGLNLRHWPEWPDGVQNGYIYMQAYRKDITL